MFHLQKATQLTYPSLGIDAPETLTALAAHYAVPPATRPDGSYLRVNMISSVDGASDIAGRSGGLAGEADTMIFRVLRALSDVVLVGSATAIIEDYSQPAADEAFAAARRTAGQTPAPALALLSGSLDLPLDYSPLTSPETVIFTRAAAPADRRAALRAAGATLVDCGEDDVDPALVRAACVARGWTRIGSEGGPRVLASLLAADQVDELCLTVSPFLTGGSAPRIAHGATPARPRRMTLHSVLGDADGYLFQRWTRPDQ